MTAAPAATQPNALERYRAITSELDALRQELDELGWETADLSESPRARSVLSKMKAQRVTLLIALRDVLVERLNEGQAKIYTKRTIDTPSPATTEMEEKFVTLLHEYEAVTKELHSLAPQMAVEAYTQSLKAAAPAKSNGARPSNSQKPYGTRH